MRNATKVVLSIILTVVAAGAWAGGPVAGPKPPQATPPAAVDIVIDYESGLALVPEGTVLPKGLEIGLCNTPSARECRETRDASRLVFAYGAPERIARAAQPPALPGNPPPPVYTTIQCGSFQNVRVNITYAPSSTHSINCYVTATGPMIAAMQSTNSYPTTVLDAFQSWYMQRYIYTDYDETYCAPSARRCELTWAGGFPDYFESEASVTRMCSSGPCEYASIAILDWY